MPAVTRCVFRVAAGPRIGFGHLMRARALARCLSVPAVFSIRGGAAASRAARTLGCRIVGRAVPLSNRDVVVVDDPAPAAARTWLNAARRAGARSVSVYDSSRTHRASLVVNGNIFAKRSAAATPRGALLGPSFYPLDRHVLVARQLRPRAPRALGRHPRVLIALGGGRHVRMLAPHLVNAMAARHPQFMIEVAAGFARGAAPRLQGARWLQGSRGLGRALGRADVVVASGGVTLYEACAIGVPVVACAVVASQRHAIRRFAQCGAVLDAGTISQSSRDLARVTRQVETLLTQQTLRTRLSRRAAQLVDARGAERVAASIHRLGGVRG